MKPRVGLWHGESSEGYWGIFHATEIGICQFFFHNCTSCWYWDYLAQLIHPPRKVFQGTHKLPYAELCDIIPIPFDENGAEEIDGSHRRMAGYFGNSIHSLCLQLCKGSRPEHRPPVRRRHTLPFHNVWFLNSDFWAWMLLLTPP